VWGAGGVPGGAARSPECMFLSDAQLIATAPEAIRPAHLVHPSDPNLTPVKFLAMDNIRGKTIAITGAARGIGHATAKALLARGARVVIGDRDVALLEQAVSGLSKMGMVSGHPMDVTDKESFATFLDKARTDGHGHIDVLINNAGVMPVGPFLDQSEQAIRSSIEVNLYGVLTGCQLVLPEMVARRSGHVVNISSMAGMIAVPGQAVYAGTKFAIVGLSTALSDEFAPQGVEVSAVLPTFTNTELIAGTKATGAQKPVQPEDIAAAIVKVLDKPKTIVSVPPWGRVLGAVTSMLAPRGRRWLGKKLGTDRVFLEFDAKARQSYEQRAQAAQGVVDPDQKS
jgi:short-subunit dehydrogenase